jgi:hypothetical protein
VAPITVINHRMIKAKKKCWEEKKCVKIWTHMDADFYTPFSHFGVFVTISSENKSVKV